MFRFLALIAALTALAACTPPAPDDPLADLGAFRLGHNIVIADKAQTVPGSREASKKEWVDALTRAVDERFSQYPGNQLYHLGISVEGFNLATGGIPLVFTPKSALVIKVTIWDDAANAKLNAEPKTLTVFETTSSESAIVGSGYSRTREEQILGLSRNAVRQIENWMVEQRKDGGWFEPRPGAATDAVVPSAVGTTGVTGVSNPDDVPDEVPADTPDDTPVATPDDLQEPQDE